MHRQSSWTTRRSREGAVVPDPSNRAVIVARAGADPTLRRGRSPDVPDGCRWRVGPRPQGMAHRHVNDLPHRGRRSSRARKTRLGQRLRLVAANRHRVPRNARHLHDDHLGDPIHVRPTGQRLTAPPTHSRHARTDRRDAAVDPARGRWQHIVEPAQPLTSVRVRQTCHSATQRTPP